MSKVKIVLSIEDQKDYKINKNAAKDWRKKGLVKVVAVRGMIADYKAVFHWQLQIEGRPVSVWDQWDEYQYWTIGNLLSRGLVVKRKGKVAKGIVSMIPLSYDVDSYPTLETYDGTKFNIKDGILVKYYGIDKEVKIPQGVKRIGNYAFSYCNNLERITIPDDVLSIGEEAFIECTSLKNITIPDSVKKIGQKAFFCCDLLTYNEYGNAYYLGNETNKYIVLVKAKSTDITSCTINENTKVICDFAFSGCNSLVSITIPDGVTSIGNSAFYGCALRNNVKIGNGVKK